MQVSDPLASTISHADVTDSPPGGQPCPAHAPRCSCCSVSRVREQPRRRTPPPGPSPSATSPSTATPRYTPTLVLLPRIVYDTAHRVDSARVVDSVRTAENHSTGFAVGTQRLAHRLLLCRAHVGGDAAAGSASAAGPDPARGPVRRPAHSGAATAAAHHERAAGRHLLGGQRQAAHRPVRGRAAGGYHPEVPGDDPRPEPRRTTTAAAIAGAGRRSPSLRSRSGRYTPARSCPASRWACG